MTTNTYSASAIKPAGASTVADVLRELFQATPLFIFAVALRDAKRRPSQR
jgi:hypothetical protein